MKTQLHAALCQTTIATFMAELHECIVLHITAQRQKKGGAKGAGEEEEDEAPHHNYPYVIYFYDMVFGDFKVFVRDIVFLPYR